jgi:hypothetical protein
MASTASTATKRATVFLMVGFSLLKQTRSLETEFHSSGTRLPHIQRLVKVVRPGRAAAASFDKPVCV